MFWTPEVKYSVLDIDADIFSFKVVERNFSSNFLGMKIIRCRVSKSHHCQTVRSIPRNPFYLFFYWVWTVPLVTPTSSPIIPTPRKQEVVLFVGYPCLGKSTFFKRYFQSEAYLHINQDTLKSRDKCVKAVKNALASGQSCVIGLSHLVSSCSSFFDWLALPQTILTAMLLRAKPILTFAQFTTSHLGISHVHGGI